MAHLPKPSETARTVARFRELIDGAKRKPAPKKQKATTAKRQAATARRSGPQKKRLSRSAQETARIVKRLRELLSVKGKSFREAARILKRPRSTLHSIAVRYRIKHRPPTELSARKNRTLEQLVDEAKLSPSQIAQKLAINKSTVTRALARKLDAETPDCDFRPKRVRGKRCLVHGLVQVWPCVACAAVSMASCG